MRTMRHQRGYAAIMAMLLLAMGAIMAAWIYSMLSTATAVARNNTAHSKAMMAAESGLTYVTARIERITNDAANPITATTETEALHKVILSLSSNWSVTDSPLKVSQDEANPFVQDPDHPFASASAVLLAENCGFDFALEPNDREDSDYTLTVTGRYGNASRVIGLHLSKGLPDMPGWMNYPLISRGEMNVTNGSVDLYRWDSDRYPGPPVTGGADRTDAGTVIDLPGGDGHALEFRDSPDPDSLSFPSKYPKSDLYAKLEAMATGNAPVLTSFQPRTQRVRNKDEVIPESSLTNVYIPPNTTVTFGANVTLNGIIYVGWPNTLTFGNNVTLNGIIVYQKPAVPPTPGESSPSYIDVERTISMTSDPEQADRNVLAAFQRASASTTEAQAYANMLWPWTVVAPDTDWNMAEGNTQGGFQFTGNIHIRDLLKAAGGGTINADTYCFHGVVLCEGSVRMNGNRELSFDPPDPEDPRNHLPNGVALDVAHGGYWER